MKNGFDLKKSNPIVAEQMSKDLTENGAAIAIAIGMKIDGTGLHFSAINSVPSPVLARMCRDLANELDPKN